MRERRDWTAKDVERVKELLTEGYTRADIANVLNRTHGSVCSLCSRLRIRLWCRVRSEDVAALFSHEVHDSCIATQLGCDEGTVRRHRAKLGLVRKRGVCYVKPAEDGRRYAKAIRKLRATRSRQATRKYKWSERKLAFLKLRLDQGFKVKQIADELGKTYWCVYKAAQLRGWINVKHRVEDGQGEPGEQRPEVRRGGRSTPLPTHPWRRR